MNVSPQRLVTRLADPSLTAALSHFVRARVPESEVDDIVQSTIADALDAEQAPEQDEELVRWVYGICRHKVVDWFRRARREVPRDLEADDAAVAAESAPQSAMDLLRWAQKELPEGEEHKKTLEWMLREGQGEKLESIAAEANLPAPRVRQRVSRLRRHYKARWAAQIAALAALVLIAIAIGFALRRKHEVVAPAPGPTLEPSSSPTVPLPLPPEAPALSTQPPEPAPSALPLDAKPSPTSSAGPTITSRPTPTPAPNKPMPKKGGPTKGFSSDPSMGTDPVPAPPAPTSSLDGWGAQTKGASKAAPRSSQDSK
ncbi:MAG TPA: hypothetical protein VIF15_09500 [Polyangiaceae bacterium]